MTSTKQATIRCVYCDAEITQDTDGLSQAWRTSDGWGTCPDGGWHRPVIVEAGL